MNIRYLSVILASFALLITCYVAVYYAALDSEIRNDAYIKGLIASSIDENKVLIVGGSSSKHGFDNELLEKTLGLPVINMAFAASLSIDYRVYQVDKYSNPGDVVIMPLEWEYYFREDDNAEHYKSTFLYFGDYFHSLSLLEKADILLHTSPNFVLSEANRVLIKSDKMTNIRERNIAVVKQFMGQLKRCPKHIACLNVYGGLLNTKVLASEIKVREGPKNGFVVSRRFKRALEKLASIEKDRSIKIVFTFPPYLPGPDFFTFENKNDFVFLKEVHDEMSRYGFKLVGDPRNYIHGINDMLDTRYHIKESVRKSHTNLLLNDIVDEISIREMKCGKKSTKDYVREGDFILDRNTLGGERYRFNPIKLLGDNKQLTNLSFKEVSFSVSKGIELINQSGMYLVKGHSNKPSIQFPLPVLNSGSSIVLEMVVDLPTQRKWHFFYRGKKDSKFSHARRIDFDANNGKNKLFFSLNPEEVKSMLRIDYGSTVGEFFIHSIRIAAVDTDQLNIMFLQEWQRDALCDNS